MANVWKLHPQELVRRAQLAISATRAAFQSNSIVCFWKMLFVVLMVKATKRQHRTGIRRMARLPASVHSSPKTHGMSFSTEKKRVVKSGIAMATAVRSVRLKERAAREVSVFSVAASSE